MTDQSLEAQLLPAMATIRGDLRDLVIGAMAAMTKPWKDLPEAEQVQLANMIDAHAANIVTRIAILTATAGRPTIMVTLDKLAIEERATGHFTVSKELAPALVPFTRQIVAIVAVGPQQFMGERGPAQVQKDQPGLPLGGGSGGYAAPTGITPGEPKTIVIVGKPEAPKAAAPKVEPPVAKPSAAATPRAPKAKSPKANGAAKPKVGSPFAR